MQSLHHIEHSYHILVYQDFKKINFFFTILMNPSMTKVDEIKGQSLDDF